MFLFLHYFIHTQQTPWCTLLLLKLKVPRHGKNFTTYHRTQTFMTKFTELTIHSFHNHTNQVLILALNNPNIKFSDILLLRMGLTSGLFPKIVYPVLTSPIRATCPTDPHLNDLTAPIIAYLMKSINHYAMSSSLLLLPSRYVQIICLAHCSIMSAVSSHQYKKTKL
jgi:hypothetical protein